jgi:hypothetical protein
MQALTNTRLVAIGLVCAAVLAFTGFSLTVASEVGCDCKDQGECAAGSGCYSNGSCHPTEAKICSATWNGDRYFCSWEPNTSCQP